jgi:rare lipoprotein A
MKLRHLIVLGFLVVVTAPIVGNRIPNPHNNPIVQQHSYIEKVYDYSSELKKAQDTLNKAYIICQTYYKCYDVCYKVCDLSNTVYGIYKKNNDVPVKLAGNVKTVYPHNQEDVIGPNCQFGKASYYDYGEGSGRILASGERFSNREMCAAHKTLPFGTKVKVTRADTNKSVVVRINDRGPYIRGRIIDLNVLAAKHLGIKSSSKNKEVGVVSCYVQVVD